MKLKTLATAMIAAGAVAGANAFVLYPGGHNTVLDDNIEFEVNRGGAAGVGLLEEGDSLRGVISFNTINQDFGAFASQSPVSPQITGIFQAMIPTGGITNIHAGGPAGTNLADIQWVPDPAFEAIYGTGAMIALFYGGVTLTVNSCHLTGQAFCETNATDGTPWMTVGMSDVDDEWLSKEAALTIGALTGLSGNNAYGDINYALTMLENNTGYTFNKQLIDCAALGFACAGDSMTDITGNGLIKGGIGLTNGYQARSKVDFGLDVAVPEPGSLALVGVALAGLGLAARRRKA